MLKDFCSLIVQVVSPGVSGMKYFAALFASAVAYVLPQPMLRDMAVGAFVLILVDTLTGVAAAWSTCKAVKSAKFGRVLTKILAYGSVIVVASIAGKFLLGGSPLLQSAQVAVLTLIMCREGLSVLENVNGILGWKFKFLEDLLKGRAKNISLDEEKQNEQG